MILPARVPGFVPGQLDLLAASGRVVWVGRGPLGPADGRIALYRRERAPLLLPAPEDYAPPGVAHAVILEQLGARGACFLSVLEQAVQQAHPEARPRRVPGTWVILVEGWPVFWLGPRGRRLWSFPDPAAADPGAALAAACRALGRLPRTTRGRGLVIESIDGEPAHASPLAPLLRACGFESDYKGLTPGPVASGP